MLERCARAMVIGYNFSQFARVGEKILASYLYHKRVTRARFKRRLKWFGILLVLDWVGFLLG